MKKTTKRKPLDIGNIVGAVIFIALFLGLIYLGLSANNEDQFNSSFFEDVGKVMNEED